MKYWAEMIGVMLLASGCVAVLQPRTGTATAELRNAQGQVVGGATFTEVTDGVRILVEVRGLSPGLKGVHIHDVGKCDPPGFTSAGDHFNPGKRQHGVLNPQGPHAGDLPNIQIDGDGNGRMETLTDRVTLGSGPTALFDGNGRALVVHGAPDDFKTDPTGNSGARIVCGVVERSGATSDAGGGPAGSRY